ncbi:MAG: hypothetical protein ACTSWN_15340, partial [Promethearchaeota archaeon]
VNTSDVGPPPGIFTLTVSAALQNYSQAKYSFTIEVLKISTALELVNVPTSVIWGENFTAEVRFRDTVHGWPMTGTISSPHGHYVFNPATQTYLIEYNSTNIGVPAGWPITIVATRDHYEDSTTTFVIQIEKVPTQRLDILVNGISSPTLDQSPRLLETVNFTVYYQRQDGTFIPNASVQLEYINDITGNETTVQFTEGNGYYWAIINLTFDSFKYYEYSQKSFLISAYKQNYTRQQTDEQIFIRPIEVNLTHNMNPQDPTDRAGIAVEAGKSYTFEIHLDIDNFTGSFFEQNIQKIKIMLYSDDLGFPEGKEMENLGDGTYRIDLSFPVQYSRVFTMTVRIVIEEPDLLYYYKFPRDEGLGVGELEFSFRTNEPPNVPYWLFYIVLGALIALTIWFILYQVRFKYPKTVRMIRDLQAQIARGKRGAKIKPPKVVPRETNIYNKYAKILNQYSFLQTADQAKLKVIGKGKGKVKGYVEPEDNLQLEFGLEKKPIPSRIEEKPPAVAVTPPKKKLPEKAVKKAPAVKPKMPTVPAVPPTPKLGVKPSVPSVPSVPKVPTLPGKPLPKPTPGIAKRPAIRPPTQEGVYAELVKLEQKKYKAERSLRDLKAKFTKGILTEEEYNNYKKKFEDALENIKENIATLRRQLVNF